MTSVRPVKRAKENGLLLDTLTFISYRRGLCKQGALCGWGDLDRGYKCDPSRDEKDSKRLRRFEVEEET